MNLEKLSSQVAEMALSKILVVLGQEEEIGMAKAMSIHGVKSRLTLIKYIELHNLTVIRTTSNYSCLLYTSDAADE